MFCYCCKVLCIFFAKNVIVNSRKSRINDSWWFNIVFSLFIIFFCFLSELYFIKGEILCQLWLDENQMSSYTSTNRWCVKITGLSTDITTSDLSNQFELTTQRIRLPEPQGYSSECYALIDGFKSEKEAVRFVSGWNEAFKRGRIGMRCELDTTVTDEANITTKFTEDNDSYRSRGDSHSKKRTPCRHGDSCFTVDCPYKHSPEWRACKEGAQCDDFDCTANHPRNRKIKCKYGSACQNRKSGCSYLHPGANKPKRSFGNDEQSYQHRIHHSSDRSTKVRDNDDDERTHFHKQRSPFQSDDEDFPKVRHDNFFFTFTCIDSNLIRYQMIVGIETIHHNNITSNQSKLE